VTEEGAVESGQGLVGRVWTSGDAAWIEDVLNEADEPRIVPALRSGLRTAVGVPIMAGGRVCGVLEYFGTGIRREDEHMLLRLYDLGRKLGPSRTGGAGRAGGVSRQRAGSAGRPTFSALNRIRISRKRRNPPQNRSPIRG
jgi:hypothetical protein